MNTPEKPVRGSAEHLYVMQNAWGLIKVGRSRNPEQRRSCLERASGCPIALVAVLENKGHREQALHATSIGGRLIGEWFAPTVAVKAAISREFRRKLSFPYADASDGEAARQSGWIDLGPRRRLPERRGSLYAQQAADKVVAKIMADGQRKREAGLARAAKRCLWGATLQITG